MTEGIRSGVFLAGAVAGGLLAGCGSVSAPQTMSAACRDAAGYTAYVSGLVDPAAAEALQALGFAFSMSFDDTPWARAGAAYSWETTDREDWGVVDVEKGRRLRRYRESARYAVFADGVPGAAEGVASCDFIQDADTGEFWFWGGGDWINQGDPSVHVVLGYNEYLRHPEPR